MFSVEEMFDMENDVSSDISTASDRGMKSTLDVTKDLPY
mgnify:CR=1 FL=1